MMQMGFYSKWAEYLAGAVIAGFALGVLALVHHYAGPDFAVLSWILFSLAIGVLLIVAFRARRRAHHVQRAGEDDRLRLQTLMEHLPVVLFAVDRHGYFLFSRGKGLARLGLAPDEVVGKSVFEVYRNCP